MGTDKHIETTTCANTRDHTNANESATSKTAASERVLAAYTVLAVGTISGDPMAPKPTDRFAPQAVAYWRLHEVDGDVLVSIVPHQGAGRPFVMTIPSDAPVSEFLARLRDADGVIPEAMFGALAVQAT